jgi:hypothetical protein
MIADYSDRASFRKQPLMNICAGLTTVAALTENRFVVDRWQTPLNMYLVAVAETGEGKEAPRNAIKAAINVVRGLSRVKESVSSSTALLRALAFADRHDIILLLDEFGRLLSVAQKPSNGHLYELVSELMRLYGQANTTNCGKIYANREDNISSINRPFVNVFGTTTKRSLTDALSSKDVVNGMLNRLLIVQMETRQPAYNEPNDSIDQGLENALKNLDSLDLFDVANEAGNYEGDPVTIDVTPDAEKLLVEYRDEADRRRIRDGELGSLHARAFENAIKVAGVLAVGCAAEIGPLADNKPIVDSKCARWAIKFVRQCVRKVVELGTDEIADNEIHRTTIKILNYITDMTRNWERTKAPRDDNKRDMNLNGLVARAQICKRFQKIPARLRDEAIQTLIESEDIKPVPRKDDNTVWYTPLEDE